MPPMSYGYRSLLALLLEAIWCSWRNHKWRKDFKGNQRCEVCLYSSID